MNYLLFAQLRNRIATLERRVRELERDSHPPIDLTPLVKELVRAELQGKADN